MPETLPAFRKNFSFIYRRFLTTPPPVFDAARYTLFRHGRADPEMIRNGLTDLSELLRERISRGSAGDRHA